MTGEADCRKCMYYRSIDDLLETSPVLAEQLLSLERVTGAEILGYCTRREKPVYYYTGKCRFFRARIVKVRPLSEFFGEVMASG
ncbi:MAG: hypothetical protein GSR77_00305 [Desulfurococcales archaeon]|nr:hypothetical protein [Desulfurococcales archaeon]